jgi:hypothetical protein
MTANSPSAATKHFPGKFLRTLYNSHLVKRDLELELRCIHKDREHPVVRRFYNNLSEIKNDWKAIQSLNKRGYNVHFSVILRDRRNGHKLPQPLTLFCLWVDIDVGPDKRTKTIKEALTRIRRLKSRPTIIVMSGHGLHCYWCFKKLTILDPSEVTQLLRAICEETRGDRQSAEIARLLRMPNTINWKDARP